MFSDFSLKALIKQWRNEEYFGPNPFVHFSSYTGKFNLRFDPKKLLNSPSAQLQTVA